MNEVDTAVASDLTLDRAQVARVTSAVITWARTRATPPDGDPRVVRLMRDIAELVPTLRLQFDERRGVVVVHAQTSVTLLLDRGATWLRGGAWQNVVVAAVSSETPTTISHT